MTEEQKSQVEAIKMVKQIMPDWLRPMNKQCANGCGNIIWGRKMGNMIVPLRDENNEDVHICGHCLIERDRRIGEASNRDAAIKYQEAEIARKERNKESGSKKYGR